MNYFLEINIEYFLLLRLRFREDFRGSIGGRNGRWGEHAIGMSLLRNHSYGLETLKKQAPFLSLKGLPAGPGEIPVQPVHTPYTHKWKPAFHFCRFFGTFSSFVWRSLHDSPRSLGETKGIRDVNTLTSEKNRNSTTASHDRQHLRDLPYNSLKLL